MADKKTETAATVADAMGEQMKAAGETLRKSGERMAETGAELGMRLLDQAEANTREAFVAMRAAAQARDFSAVMKVQADFIREQGNRAMTQAREIGEMISSFGRDVINQAAKKD